jgi:arginyl-tRNA synthetase
MPDPTIALDKCVREAMAAALGEAHASADPMIRRSANPQFGDYQANVAMSLGKALGRKPREVAEAIVARLHAPELLRQVEVAGPGFINLHLRESFVAQQAQAMAAAADLGIRSSTQATQTVVLDYSSPNVAKQMHVGHIRSSIIGDALGRVLEAQGHRVIRQNHVGDWGTQFGMLIEHMVDQKLDQPGAIGSLGDLNSLYQDAKKRFDAEPAFAERARQRVVALQGGDEHTLALWRKLVEQSERHFDEVYTKLGVKLSLADVRGESFYNPLLAQVVADLQAAGLLQTSQGAAVVFPPGFVDENNQPLPLIVRKSDGGYLYATTDLAAARYRIRDLKADRIIYVTDARQSQHFAMVFASLKLAGWVTDAVRLDHVPFGSILGKDKKPFKTREGGTVSLLDLLHEADERAAKVIEAKNAQMPDDQKRQVAHVVGIGALKYADLSNDRIKDYVFDWDRMLAMEGNTAPYLQYSYTRIRSIFRKAGASDSSLGGGALPAGEPAERALLITLLQYAGTVDAVAQSLQPHRLCNYLYELATGFHQFYEQCRVVDAEPAVRDARLRLCALVARVLKHGLELLGIGVVEQM